MDVLGSAERANVPVSMTRMSGPAAAPMIAKSQEVSAWSPLVWGSLWAVASVTMTTACGQTAARRTAAGGAYARGAPVSVRTTRRKPGQSASPLKNQPSPLFSARKIAAVVRSAERANVPASMTTTSGPAAAPTIAKSQEASAGQ